MLIVVLVICLGLVSLALVFGHSMMMSYRGADNDLAGRQAEAAIRGAEQYAEAVISQTAVANTMPARSSYQANAVPVGEAKFWFIGVPLGSDPIDKPAFGLVDEASKLNLNSVGVDVLSLMPDMTLDLAAAIKQWRTTQGTDPTSGGISFNTVKAGPFESPEELALVNGGTDPSVLYGDDANLNHVIDPEESSGLASSSGIGANGNNASPSPSISNFSGSGLPGLLEYVTTFSREPNVLSDGTRRGNVLNGINGIRAALTTALGSSRAEAIAQSGEVRGVRRFASVVDFCSRAQLTPDEWDKVTPYLTMGGGTYTVGLINVNTASATVLSCLPGMTTALAQQLVSARPQPGDSTASNLAWIVPVLGTQARTIGRYLTTKSYQFSVDVAAVGRHGRGYRRTLFILDTSTDPSGRPQIVYRRNLTNLGWALGKDARDTLRDSAAKGDGSQP